MDEQYGYDNMSEGRYYASLTFFLTITGILIVFYNWSKYLERKEALKSFEKIIEDEKKKKDILAKHGLENLSDKKHSFHGLYNVNTPASIDSKMEEKLKFLSTENLKVRLSNVKYFGTIDEADSFKNDAKMLLNLSEELEMDNDNNNNNNNRKSLSIKKLCTVDMAILKSNMNINGIKRLVHQYALSKSKLTGGAGKLTDEDKPPLFVGEFSMLALDEDELNHHTIEEIFKTEYDGVLITQVDIAANKKGQQWVFQMFQDIELYLKENDVNKIILVEDAASSFANDNFDIQNTIDGIVMFNPTMDMDGNLKPFFGERYNNIQNLTRLLKDVTSRRQNFVVIGLEVFSNEDCIDPSAIKRFFRRSWAGDIQMACTICTDPTFTDPKAVFNDASKSGSAILSVVDMLTEGVGKSIGDRVRNLIKNRGYTSVASSSQVTRKWNPETCLRPDNNNNYTVDTRELIAGLTTALTDQEYNYKLKKEDEDASPLKIKPVVAVIKEANMAKFSPEGKLGQKKTHRRWSFLSQTPESPQKQGGRHSRHWSAHAGNGGNVQSSVRRRGSSYDYMSMSTKSSRSSSTSSGRSSWHQLENDPGFAPNQLEKPMLFLNTINDDGLQDIGEGEEEEEEEEEGEEEHEDKKEEVIKKDGIKKKNTKKLIKSAHMLDNIYAVDSPVKDCGGQKEFGTRCTMNDFEEVLGLLRLLRSNNCLGNLSEQTEREVYVGSDRKNVKKKNIHQHLTKF